MDTISSKKSLDIIRQALADQSTQAQEATGHSDPTPPEHSVNHSVGTPASGFSEPPASTGAVPTMLAHRQPRQQQQQIQNHSSIYREGPLQPTMVEEGVPPGDADGAVGALSL